ncbi:hypothetical protein [Actinacidiphila acididurans]|uniref:Uncharacterized protein n=1 Tax=Actinacidiphila acididurans TaxID=2784346 RepID=A0ABS2U6B1_9ACTN|nr:hypothetical protein [Actinacidiphila acididurans]MBM9510035.1 hypothetical protein [Actinacidiphila acididurans]
MRTTEDILTTTADTLAYTGLWTGDHFAHGTALTVTAAIYHAATGHVPDALHADDDAALALITANPQTMYAIQALSDCLDTEPPTDGDTGRPDHIEHIERYAAEPALGADAPPTTSEVIGRILRAAHTHDHPKGQAA